MQITLIRHLPTEWNNKTWLQGRKDIGISQVTKKFEQKISMNKLLLKQLEPFDIVLASTLKRAQQTAELYGYTFEIDCLLDELDFGPFEGQPKEKLYLEYGEQWFVNPRELVLGESLLHFEKRISLFLEKYQKFDNLLVFGHGSWIRALRAYHKNGDINQMNKITVLNNECITFTIP